MRGLFKDIHGRMEFDWQSCLDTTFSGEIDATKLWTGEAERDAHLRSADFFDVESHPAIRFQGRLTDRTGDTHFKAEADLTIRGTTQTVPLDVAYLGEWNTPFWVGDENRGDMKRAGWEATGRLDRHAFGVSWQDELPDGGLVVSDEIEIDLDIEVIALEDLKRTGAIEYYPDAA